ncbi:YMGG-like glycine zipper-containing protein [Roseomonas fluvialis]
MIPATLALAAGLALGACGNSPGQRAVTGGLLGAGTGAAIGSFSGNAGTGALIGGAVGAVGGAATAPGY